MKALWIVPIVLSLGACASFDDYGYDTREYRGSYVVRAPSHYHEYGYPSGYFYDPWYASAYGYGIWRDPWLGYGYRPGFSLGFGLTPSYGGYYGYAPWGYSWGGNHVPRYRREHRGLRSGNPGGPLSDQVRMGRNRDYGNAPGSSFSPQRERAQPAFGGERERGSFDRGGSYDRGGRGDRANEGLPQ